MVMPHTFLKVVFMQIDLIVLSWIPHILFSVQRQLTRLKQHLCYKQLLFVRHLQFLKQNFEKSQFFLRFAVESNLDYLKGK
ncbi:hypothetical protein J555_2218 [Acinetobacter baumannii 1146103]|nr:hypothetical protein J555_2218 [Acinetobacter baumannii 1146103]